MQKVEQDFFEEFKRLDALCRDLLSAKRGVSAYLERMEQAPQVPGWRDDYHALKHLRWVRNKIAHETGFAGCTPGDLQRLTGFTERVLRKEDPLALLYQLERAQQGARRQACPAEGSHPSKKRAAPRAGGPAPQPQRIRLCAAVLLALFASLAAYLFFLPRGPAAKR